MPQGAAFGSQSNRAQTSIGGGGNSSRGTATGARGPLGPTGDISHTTTSLGVGSPYQGAVADYGSNYLGDPASRVVKALTGVGLQQPNPNRPSTYANGLSHTGVDPLGMALGVGGAVAGVPVGAIYGLGKTLTGWDGPMVTVGNGSPGAPQPGQGFNYSGTGPQGRYGPGTSAPGQTGALGNPTQGGSMGTPATPLGGAPFGAQPSAPALGAPAAPASGMAGIANHSLPYGYNSMFPNSLTDQDKALLYAKALGGSMG